MDAQWAKKSMSNLNEFLDNSTLSFQGVRFDVRACDRLTRSGASHHYEALVHPGGVVILPLWDEHSILMIRNYRFAVGETLWELPAGTLEPDEEPEKSAFRELKEETGYEAKAIALLGRFYSSPGISNEVITVYVAKDLHFVGQQLDDGETITTEVLTWKTIYEMIRSGEIRDSHAISTFFLYRLMSETTERKKEGYCP